MALLQTIKNRINKLARLASESIDKNKYSGLVDWYYWIKANHLCSRVSVNHRGIQLDLFLPEDEYSELLRDQNVYEPGLTDLLIDRLRDAEKKDQFWNVGAYCGYYTVLAYQLLPEASQIHSFEPYYVYRILERNADAFAQGSLNNRLGLSDTKKEKPLPKIKGDDYAKSQKNPTIIKMDIEGEEYKALQGMSQILSDSSPELFLELHPKALNKQGESVEEVLEYLRKYDYKFEWIKRFRHRDYEISQNLDGLSERTAPFLIRAK